MYASFFATFLALPNTLLAQAGDDTPSVEKERIEEIVITGTYLGASSAETHAALTVFDREALDALGATDVQDFVANLTANAGSLGNSASNWVGGDSSRGQASVNLRNLGSGATLVLLDGHRLLRDKYDAAGSAYADIRTLIPTIVIDRLDVLKDGNSALYGSDAIAGVVNFITTKGFEGWDTQLDWSVDHESGQQTDALLETMWGRTFSRGEALVAASYLDRAGLQFADRYERYGRSGLSSFGQPGRYIPLHEDQPPAPTTSYWHSTADADPATFQGSLPDLDCDRASQADGPMGSLGIHPTFPTICVYDYASFFHLVRPTGETKFHVKTSYDATPHTTLTASLTLADHESTRGNSLYPDVRYRRVPDHHFGLQLDAARRGFEPVPYQALQRLLGGSSQSTQAERPLLTDSENRNTRLRLQIGSSSDLSIGDHEWHLKTSLVRSSLDNQHILPTDVLSDRTDLALAGFGGPNCDPASEAPGSGNVSTGNCFYYNPFQTSVFDPVTGNPWDLADRSPWPADPIMSVAEAARKYQNPDALYGWLHGIQRRESLLEQTVFDITATGLLARGPHGPIDVALGAQFRRESADVDYDAQSNAFNLAFLSGNSDWSTSLRSWSLFIETHTPLRENVEMRVAGRYEKFNAADQHRFDPKVSFLVSATSSLALRASWGTSFKVGSLLQSGGNLTLFENTHDPFSNAVGFAYRTSLGSGNPDLEPEEATAFNLGFTWEPAFLDGFEISFDTYEYAYENLIARERHQTLVDMDNALRCPNGVNHDIAAGPLCGVVDHDGDGVTNVFSVGAGIPDKVVRRTDGFLRHTVASYFNAPRLQVGGYDIAAKYAWETENLGSFQVRADLNFATDYTITLADGTVVKGLGFRNIANSIGRSMPEYRFSSSLSWTFDRHAASLSLFRIAEYTDESPQSAFLGAYIGFWETIESMTVLNGQYRVALPTRHDSELTLGVKNLLNAEAPWVNVDGAYDYYTHDPIGRVYYVRYRLSVY